MPLEKGNSRGAIAHNIETEQNAGKSHEQSVAIALHTAKDCEGPQTVQSLSDIQKANEKYWNTSDEVSPTQSAPPDSRSDNLLEPGPVIPVYGESEVYDEDVIEKTEDAEKGTIEHLHELVNNASKKAVEKGDLEGVLRHHATRQLLKSEAETLSNKKPKDSMTKTRGGQEVVTHHDSKEDDLNSAEKIITSKIDEFKHHPSQPSPQGRTTLLHAQKHINEQRNSDSERTAQKTQSTYKPLRLVLGLKMKKNFMKPLIKK